MNKKLVAPFIITLISTITMFISIFLPHINYYSISYSLIDLAKSVDEITRAFADSYDSFYTAMVMIIGGFTLLTVLFALLKKATPVIIFNIISAITFLIVTPVLKFWGIGCYIFFIAFVVTFVGAIWMLVVKSRLKRQKKAEQQNIQAQ